ncbi:hypothetical protein BJ875DRAFT_447436 [Amylocarpus encephaloides]|uniref:Uncharacterized protein n=1 Tax=Amylocarpus encephaloides TaxID=45428 RepID=A0A9P7YU60_9HELO|nr:hypothetical protein BJ875DRAFT_447436 [Amylocarpus encephaloides]
MAPSYRQVEQADHDTDNESNSSSPAPVPHSPSHPHPRRLPPSLAAPVFAPPLSASMGLFLDDPNHKTGTSSVDDENTSPSTNGLSQFMQSITSPSTKTSGSYDMVDGDDFADNARSSPTFSFDKHKDSSPSESARASSPKVNTRAAPAPAPSPSPSVPLHRPLPRNARSPATTADLGFALSKTSAPIVRTASGRATALRHPTPDLQVLQGAYSGNIEHLERTAERLSMTSSIDNAIKDLHDEQKRSDSRKSSLLGRSRQMSNASSIVEVNSAARSGGYSPAGFMMSSGGSFSAGGGGRMRSASKGSRLGSRPEPEMEGRPLDSFVGSTTPAISTSPVVVQAASIDERDEYATTLTKPVTDQFSHTDAAAYVEYHQPYEDRPPTPLSTHTIEPTNSIFEGFDGVHTGPIQAPIEAPKPPLHAHFEEDMDARFTEVSHDPPPQHRRSVSGGDLLDHPQRRVSSGNRLSMARPQSYADPGTGQQMVYYPAPVPMMLNLPQKLSKAASSMARNKRRSQVLSNIPPAARQSAIWLPDVLEDEPALAEDEGVQSQEYLPQHQRATMGGRRHTQDLSHLPPQLRASAFFDLPAPPQTVELKEQSAVATLDSILDASAHAPVSAFTDHAFAGQLGSEVYGKPKGHNRSSTQLLETQHKRRTSSFNLLRGRRASSQTLLDTEKEKKRSTTMSGMGETPTAKPRMTLDDEEEYEGKDTSRADLSESGDAHRIGSGEYGENEEAVEGEEDESEADDEQPEDEVYHGPPTTLLAELQIRKQQQKLRTRNLYQAYPNGMHSTLLQLDAVAQVEQSTRKQKKINLAWETSNQQQDDGESSNDDVPLAVLYSKKAQDMNRPIGLLEKREMEDNEPLSKRRERITGRPMPRATTMMSPPPRIDSLDDPEEEGETLAQRIRRLKEKGGTAKGLNLPLARPISGDFASEMMSQFGDLDKPNVKGKGREKAPSPNLEEETLGQRRKRLQAERAAEASGGGEVRPAFNQRHSMANILQAHPAANGNGPNKERPATGLLGMHEATRSSTLLNLDFSSDLKPQNHIKPNGLLGLNDQRRSSTLLNLDYHTAPAPPRQTSGGFKNGAYNDPQGGIVPPPQPQPQQQPQYNNMYGFNGAPAFPQPSLGFNNGFQNQGMMPFANPYAQMGYNPNAMNMPMGFMPGMAMNMAPNPMMGMGMGGMAQPLNQGQRDMVERWRQSVMQ